MPMTSSEMVEAVTRLVNNDYESHHDLFRTFSHFRKHTEDNEQVLTLDQFQAILNEAGIGVVWAWQLWAPGVMEALDHNRDGLIEWGDFAQIFHR